MFNNKESFTQLQEQIKTDRERRNLQSSISLKDYMEVRLQHLPKEDYDPWMWKELKRLELPHFDEGMATPACIWIQKLDTYFSNKYHDRRRGHKICHLTLKRGGR